MLGGRVSGHVPGPACRAAGRVRARQGNCAGCHNSTVKSGDLDLVSLQSPKTFEEDRETWAKVVEKLKLGQMPPPGLPRPAAETVSGRHPLDRGRIRPAGPRHPARSGTGQRAPAEPRRIQQHDPRPARRGHPPRRQLSGRHGGLRVRQHQRRAERLSPELLEKYLDAAERSRADGDLRAGRDEARGDALPRPGPHQRYARTVLASQGPVPLRRDRT